MRDIILGILVLLICSCFQKNMDSNTSVELPNMVFILVDDLGKEWVSCYGADSISTPNIDALANSGIMFNNVYSMPQCTPSRLTLITGQYPFRHGWVNHWDVPRWGGGAHFDERVNPSLFMELKNAGYRTCIAGKWQIDDFRVEPDALTKVGFDDYCMWTGYETGVPESAERYMNPYLFSSDGSETYHDQFGPDVFKDYILKFIKRNVENPFFVYYPMVLVHTPLVNPPDGHAKDDIGKHMEMVSYADYITGEIVKGLEDAGVRENTIIIWTTDNGSTRKITGSREGQLIKGGKMRMGEEGTAMPFIVSWPAQIKKPRISDVLVDFTDILPTCLDLANVKLEKKLMLGDQEQIIDGHSFKGVLMDSSEYLGRNWIMSMGGGNHARLTEAGVENQYNFRDRVLRNKKFKLYIGPERTASGFYNLERDPYEIDNLIDQLPDEEHRNNFNYLFQVALSFPDRDTDPRYINNSSQPWDVEITAQSEIWKL